MQRILKLEPHFKDVLWGGSALSAAYNMPIPTAATGEAFSASTVPGFTSTVDGADFTRYASDKSYTGEGGFNILFKLIDAKEPLSVQVHPDDELAARKAAYVQPEPNIKTGWLARYARLVTSANLGAVLK